MNKPLEQAIEQISKELRNIPKLSGRNWKEYALKLKEQRSTICKIVAIHKAMNLQISEGDRDE